MSMKKASLMIICSGFIIVAVNIYSLAQGLSVYSEPIITEENFEIEQKAPIHLGASNKFPDEKNLYNELPVIGEIIGELTIPKLKRSLPIYHGTTKEVLKKGVGHFAGSVLPGEKNNSVLSGHRDTVFRGLGDVGLNDTIIVSTDAGEFLYKIKKVRIVDKNDRTVLVPKPVSTLTITTCYPFGYIGNAPKRYILVAELISHVGV